MRTTLFEWAARQGWSKSEVARRLGYSVPYVLSVSNGQLPVTASFMGTAILTFGLEVASLFYADAGEGNSAEALISRLTQFKNRMTNAPPRP